MAERLVALDLSSVCVGYAVFDDRKLVGKGKYRQQGKDHGEKLLNFRGWLLRLLKRTHPQHVVFEAPYAGRRRFTYGVLMLYVGVVLACHFEVFEQEVPAQNRIQPNVVKRTLKMAKGDDHEDRKRLMVDEINKLYDLKLRFKPNDKTKAVSDDDIADAIAVGRTWLERYSHE